MPELRALRDRIAAGELGEILQVSMPAVGRRAAVGEFRARSGGIAIDMGVHELDQATMADRAGDARR